MKNKNILLLGLGILGACGNPSEDTDNKELTKPEKTTDERPNIILIMADDMGYSDLGCFGSDIQTPNLDQLAEEGIRLTSFYNASRSCPTRASLLTGLYQHQAGIGMMVHDMGVPSYQGYLNDSCVTIAEVLKQAGYSTYMSGKWHVGEKPPHWPRKRGFERYFGLINGASSYFNLKSFRKDKGDKVMVLDDKQYLPPDSGFYMTDAFSEYAVKYIKEHQEKTNPFFMYLAYTAPHWPLHALPEDIDKYRGKYNIGWDSLRQKRYNRMLELGIIDSTEKLSPKYENIPAWNTLNNADKDHWSLRMAVYAAMIDRMDQGIGKIMQALKETEDYDNTFIVFLADNGGCHEDPMRWKSCPYPRDGEIGTPNSFSGYDYRWANASNTPFRMFKHWVHEGGIASPFIAWYPKMIEANQKSKQVAHIIDIMPTFVELANAKYPKQLNHKTIKPMEGKSLIPVLKGNTWDSKRTLFWEHQGNCAVRSGDWKLVSRYPENEWELYNLANDRSELNNLIGENPEKVQELIKLYNNWAERCHVFNRDTLLFQRGCRLKRRPR